jgi:hypothetical protein
VQPDDKRWYLRLLFGLMMYLAGALLLGQRQGIFVAAVWPLYLAHDDWVLHHLLARKNCATAIQAVGSVVAFLGLWRAYLRAKYKMSIREWIWWRLGHEPSSGDITVSPGTAVVIRPVLSATAFAKFVYNPWQTPRPQSNDWPDSSTTAAKRARRRTSGLTTSRKTYGKQ